MKLPELLAPVSSIDTLKIAINAGADAVYLSGHKYGARSYAKNFTKEEIIEAVEFAHLRNVKVYLTVNTLIMDEEFKDVLDYLMFLYTIGVDAVLIQDIGLAKIIKRVIAGLEIHASTQMTVHNLDNLRWIKENGFSRVVLSRELSLEEVQEMQKYANKNNMELEIFGHGALCYSYSGRCYMSSLIGARSGNRGMCAQPCRQNYSLNTSDNKSLMEGYLLSPKDLYTYTQLNDLINSGISAIKIEGRMRSPEYLAITIKTYRDALDKIYKLNEESKDWHPQNKDIERLKLGFNRGFTKGNLYKKNNEEMMSQSKPGHIGLLIGNVTSYDNERKAIVVHIKSDIFPEIGDGLFIEDEDFSFGFQIDKEPEIIKKTLFYKTKRVPYGAKVYITKKNSLSSLVKDYKKDKQSNLNKSKLSFNFKIDSDLRPILKTQLELQDSNILKKNLIIESLTIGEPWEKAINKPLSSKTIRKQLAKIGDLPFEIVDITVDYNEDLFTPISSLNKLRREAIDDLIEKVIEFYKPSKDSIDYATNNLNEYKKLIHEMSSYYGMEEHFIAKDANLDIYINSLDSLEAISNFEFKNVYLEFKGDNFNEKNILEFIKRANLINSSNLVWKWPDISSKKTLKVLKSVLNTLITENIILDIMVGNLGLFEYLDNLMEKRNVEFNVFASAMFNVWNLNSLNELADFKLITLSPEISNKQYARLAKGNNTLNYYYDLIKDDETFNLSKFLKFFKVPKFADIEVLVQGNMEAMVSKTDFKTQKLSNNDDLFLQDGKNRVFPVKTSPENGIILLNSLELCLIDHLDEFIEMGINNFAIDARWKDSNYINTLSNAYFNAINKKTIAKSQVQKASFGGITKGNYIRGIKKHS